MKIMPKFQSGGTQYVTYQPVIAPELTLQTAPVSTTPTLKSLGNDGLKGIMNMTKGMDILPNEAMYIRSGIKDIFMSQSLQNSLGHTPLSGSMSSSYAELITDLNMSLNICTFNKREYDRVYNIVAKKDAFSEAAISSDGHIYVYNKDKKLQYIHLKDYIKDRSKYSNPLTNSNILWLRANDPLFVNNNQLLDTASNSITMTEIILQINNNLRSLGSSTEELNGYVKKAAGTVLSGIAALEKLASLGGRAAVDGIYKVKTKNINSLAQMEAAVNAIFDSLTPNAKRLLILKSGDIKDPLRGAKNLVSLKVMLIMNNTISYDEYLVDDYDALGNRIDKNGSGESSDPDKVKLNTTMAFLNGHAYHENVSINTGNNEKHDVVAYTQVIPGSDNKPTEALYLSELGSSGISGIVDLQHASMGGKFVQLGMADLIQLTDNKMHLIWWPSNPDGTPNLESTDAETMKKVNEEIVKLGLDPNDPKVQLIMEQYNVTDYSTLKQFIVINAMTNNKALGVDRFDGNTILQSVTDLQYKAYEDNYKAYWGKDKATAFKNLDLDHRNSFLGLVNPGDWFGNYDDVYEGLVWLPVIGHYMNAMAGTGEQLTTPQLLEYELRQAQNDADVQALLQYVNPSEYE